MNGLSRLGYLVREILSAPCGSNDTINVGGVVAIVMADRYRHSRYNDGG